MAWKQIVTKKAERVLGAYGSPLALKELSFQAISFVARCGRSNPLSFALRPFAAHRRLKTAVGVYLTLCVALAAISGPIISASSNIGGTPSINWENEADVPLKTTEAVKVPLSSYVVSQKYWFLHSGVDMAARTGEPIHPFMNGVVVQAEKNWYGYGNMVIVDHHNGYQSLYAHMSKVLVNVGDKVDTESVLGEVGSTGHSTGPHLHFEIYEEGKTVNPAAMVEI